MQTLSFNMKAGDLKKVIDLPNFSDDQRVKVTVNPETEEKVLSKAEVEKIVRSLIGSIPDTGETLEEIRMERLMKKYEALN